MLVDEKCSDSQMQYLHAPSGLQEATSSSKFCTLAFHMHYFLLLSTLNFIPSILMLGYPFGSFSFVSTA